MEVVLTWSYSNDNIILLQLTSLPALITNWAQVLKALFTKLLDTDSVGSVLTAGAVYVEG